MKQLSGLMWGIILQLMLMNFMQAISLAKTEHTNRLLQETNRKLHDIDGSLFRLTFK